MDGYEKGSDGTVPPLGGTPPTDFLAFSRQYATDMGLRPDITTWEDGQFQAFLDWWLLRTRHHFVQRDSA